MAATGVLVTMLFEESGLSFSEAHVWTVNADLNLVKDPAKELVQARANCCGAGVSLVGVRLSKVQDFRDSIVFSATEIQGIVFPTGKLYTSGADKITAGYSNDADQAKACVLLRAEAGTTKRKSIYMAGVPDVILGTDPNGPKTTLFTAWTAFLNAYINVLVTKSWGFVARADQQGALAKQDVQDLVVQAGTNRIGLVCDSGGPTYAVGKLVQTRLFQSSNSAYKSLNGIWQVSAVALGSPAAGKNTYYLLGSNQVPFSSIVRNGFVQGVDYAATRYTAVQPQGQTTRKRGNRQLAGPGRRKTKKSIVA